jgi:hypothetical protein
MEALFEAQERTIEEMEGLMRKLETEQKLTPQQAESRHQSAARPFSFVRGDVFAFCRLEPSRPSRLVECSRDADAELVRSISPKWGNEKNNPVPD